MYELYFVQSGFFRARSKKNMMSLSDTSKQNLNLVWDDATNERVCIHFARMSMEG